jgi:hypothetical protein
MALGMMTHGTQELAMVWRPVVTMVPSHSTRTR